MALYLGTFIVHPPTTARAELVTWVAGWYMHAVEHGYPHHLPEGTGNEAQSVIARTTRLRVPGSTPGRQQQAGEHAESASYRLHKGAQSEEQILAVAAPEHDVAAFDLIENLSSTQTTVVVD